MLVNIKDFGAVGDGVTDDRAAIQAAVDHAVTKKQSGILIPSGTYRVSRASASGGDPGRIRRVLLSSPADPSSLASISL